MAYDYDVFEIFNGVLTGKRSLADYAEALTRQTVIYPDNYIKMRYLENHDNFRAAALISNPEKLQLGQLSSIFNKAQHNFMPAKKCMPNTSQVFLTRTRWTGKLALIRVTIWQD
jgi:hypothetical protein